MELVGEDFFKRLPVAEVVSGLDKAARDNVCRTTGLQPDQLPTPLVTEEEVEKAVQPLRDAVTAEVAGMQRSFQQRLEEERREHKEELSKRQRLDSECGSDSEDEGPLVGTYACENGHICDRKKMCTDDRVPLSYLLFESDAGIAEYAREYLKAELAAAQTRLDNTVVECGRNGRGFRLRYKRDGDEQQFTITPARRRLDNDDNIVLFIKKWNFCMSSLNDLTFFNHGFISGAVPKYAHEETHTISTLEDPFRVKSMLALMKEGVSLKHFEEHERYCAGRPGPGRNLGRIYATALLLRNEKFSDEDYERMAEDLKGAEEFW